MQCKCIAKREKTFTRRKLSPDTKNSSKSDAGCLFYDKAQAIKKKRSLCKRRRAFFSLYTFVLRGVIRANLCDGLKQISNGIRSGEICDKHPAQILNNEATVDRVSCVGSLLMFLRAAVNGLSCQKNDVNTFFKKTTRSQK